MGDLKQATEAAVRVRATLEKASAGGYLTHAWYSYLTLADVITLLRFIEAHAAETAEQQRWWKEKEQEHVVCQRCGSTEHGGDLDYSGCADCRENSRELAEPERCESHSPGYKFDEGPRRCRGDKGHTGKHWAKTSDGRAVDPRFDYEITWDEPAGQEGRPS